MNWRKPWYVGFANFHPESTLWPISNYQCAITKYRIRRDFPSMPLFRDHIFQTGLQLDVTRWLYSCQQYEKEIVQNFFYLKVVIKHIPYSLFPFSVTWNPWWPFFFFFFNHAGDNDILVKEWSQISSTIINRAFF